jgi:hypothetical protein
MRQFIAPIRLISAAQPGAMGAFSYGGLGTSSIAITSSAPTPAGLD